MFVDASSTATDLFTPVPEGTDDLASIFANVKTAASKLGDTIHQLSNDVANLQAQNSDIANGRFTLNNAVYQWGKLDTLGKAAVVGLGWIVVRHFLRG